MVNGLVDNMNYDMVLFILLMFQLHFMLNQFLRLCIAIDLTWREIMGTIGSKYNI